MWRSPRIIGRGFRFSAPHPLSRRLQPRPIKGWQFVCPGHQRFRNYRDEATVTTKEQEEVMMSHLRLPSRYRLIAGAAMALSFAAGPVHAQGAPSGSYLRTCTHVAVHGDRLIADCRRMDGGWARTALGDIDRCAGDIGNMNGQLACN